MVRLSPKERRLFLVLAAVVAGSFYATAFLRPALKEISRLKIQQQEGKERLKMFASQYADTAAGRQEVQALKRATQKMKEQLAGIESRLISQQQVPQLLSELIKRAQESSVDLESVKQDIKEDKEGLGRLYIDLKFDSNYEGALNYIKKIEVLSPFTKIEEMELAQSKADPQRLVSAFIKLNTILGYESKNQGPLSAEAEAAARKIPATKRSPFAAGFAVRERQKKALKITGITYRKREADSSAIINNNVVRQGEEVEGIKIERILPEAVVVNDGTESYKIQVER